MYAYICAHTHNSASQTLMCIKITHSTLNLNRLLSPSPSVSDSVEAWLWGSGIYIVNKLLSAVAAAALETTL